MKSFWVEVLTQSSDLHNVCCAILNEPPLVKTIPRYIKELTISSSVLS